MTIQWKALPAKFKKAFFATRFIEKLLAGFWSPFEFEHQLLLATLRQLYITQKRSAFRTEFRAKIADLMADLVDLSHHALHPRQFSLGVRDSSVPSCGKNRKAYKAHQITLESPPPVPPAMLSPASRERRMSFDEQPILEDEILAAVADYRNGSESASSGNDSDGESGGWVFRIALEEQHSMAPSVLLPGVNHALALLTAVLMGVKGLSTRRAEYDPVLRVLLSLYSMQSLDAFEAQLLGCMKCFVREEASTVAFLPAILSWFVRHTAIVTRSLSAFGLVSVSHCPTLPYPPPPSTHTFCLFSGKQRSSLVPFVSVCFRLRPLFPLFPFA
jgi:hypothetical protein